MPFSDYSGRRRGDSADILAGVAVQTPKRSLAAVTLACLLTVAASTVNAQPPTNSIQLPQLIHSDSPGQQLQENPITAQPTVRLSLEAALLQTLWYNPDLIATRQGLRVSAEAVQVAKLLPVNLNPTLAVDVRPWVFGVAANGSTEKLLPYVDVSFSQPIELGGRVAKRTMIAQAEYEQTYWNIVEAELLALTQTYRAYETALYRRDKLQVARDLAALNDRLARALQGQLEANQVVSADVVFAEVENLAARQRVEVAQVDYADALAALRQQIGVVELAASAEPEGKLESPQDSRFGDEGALLQTALTARPEVQTARAEADRSCAAWRLAQADRIPIPSLGPIYEKDESGSSFYGMTVSSPLPIWNDNGRQARQREAEYHRDVVAFEQTEKRVVVQVKTSLARWNQAQRMSAQTVAIMSPVEEQMSRMERLFAAGQTDLVKLLTARQRWLDSANTQLDAAWQATQAYADLLSAMGGVPLLGTLPVPPQR